MLFVCYPAWGTCKKARAWLDANGISYNFRDIKTDNPNAAEIKEWHSKTGVPLKKFFNTSGLKYKELELAKKLPAMSDEEQIELLASDGMLVKRPILVSDTFVLTGFKEQEWEERFGI